MLTAVPRGHGSASIPASHYCDQNPQRDAARKDTSMQRMKQVIVRQNGLYSLYLRIPPEVVHANNLKRNDLAYLVPVKGRPDKNCSSKRRSHRLNEKGAASRCCERGPKILLMKTTYSATSRRTAGVILCMAPTTT
jgi:hypothetical protein